MKNKKNFRMVIASTIIVLGLMAYSYPQQSAWEVPAKYESMVNEFPGEDDGVGKELYAQHCRSCHGKEGYGDGNKAGELDTEMRELGSEEVQGQTDGALFYKSFIGRDEMPNFEKKIKDDEDRWMVVNYLRSLEE